MTMAFSWLGFSFSDEESCEEDCEDLIIERKTPSVDARRVACRKHGIRLSKLSADNLVSTRKLLTTTAIVVNELIIPFLVASITVGSAHPSGK